MPMLASIDSATPSTSKVSSSEACSRTAMSCACSRPSDARQQDGELVAAEPHDDVLRAQSTATAASR